MGLNDNMFDDPLDGESANSTTDPVVTPVEAQKGADSTFEFETTGGTFMDSEFPVE